MRPIKTLGIAVAASLALSCAAGATALDFEIQNGGGPIGPGNIAGSEFTDFGVTLSSNKQLALFNSNCGTDFDNSCNSVGTDSDLATGPAFGSTPEGNVLIINGGTNADPDDDASGGTFVFTFAKPVLFQSIRLLDLDETGFNSKLSFDFEIQGGGSLQLSGNGQLAPLQTLVTPLFSGDNSVRDVAFNIGKVTELTVTFSGISGAIAAVDYAPVPLPAALPLAAVGIAALGGLALGRRGKQSA